MYGFLFFIPTLALVPHVLFLLPIFYFFYKNKSEISVFKINLRKIDKNLIIIFIIVLLCFINLVISFFNNKIDSFSDLFPFTFLMFFSFLYSKVISVKDLKILIYLILIESFIVIIEYALKINTFIPSLKNTQLNLENVDQFYYSRPFGLSSNSSIIAYKIFLSFLLLDILKLKTVMFQIVRLILFVAIFLTFNRTVFLVLLIYLVIKFIKPSLIIFIDFLYLKIKKKYLVHFIVGGIGILFFSVFISLYLDTIISQLTRNKGIDLAGRDEIWVDFFSFIEENFWLGNGSKKCFVDYYSGPIHAHNSFIQILANNGIIIFSFFLYLIFSNINRNNVVYVISIIIYSLFQYGIFWGVSLVDILFFMILFRKDIYAEELSTAKGLS